MASAAAPAHVDRCWPRLVRCGADAAGCRRLRHIYTARPPHARVDSSQRRRLQLMLQSGRPELNHLKRGNGGGKRGGVSGMCMATAVANAGSGGGSGAASASKEPDHPVIELLREASWEVQDLTKAAVAVLRRKPTYAPLQVTPGYMLHANGRPTVRFPANEDHSPSTRGYLDSAGSCKGSDGLPVHPRIGCLIS